MAGRSQNVSEATSEVEQTARTAKTVESGEGHRGEVDILGADFPGTRTLWDEKAEGQINFQEQLGANFLVQRDQSTQSSPMAASSTRDVRTTWVFSGSRLGLFR